MTDALVGGAERLVAAIGRNWPPGAERVLVVILGRGSLSDRLEASFDRVHYLDVSPSSRNIPGMVRKLERVIRAEKPDVITSHMFHADLITALARTRVPRVTTLHTHGFGPGDHPLTKLIARAVGLLSFRFAAVIPTSDSPAMAKFARRYRYRNVVEPILNGAEIPPAPSFSAASRVFCSIGRNHPVKGHAVLFAAFARIADRYPEWVLRAVGPGVSAEEMEVGDARALELVGEGRITLEGPTDHPERVLADSAALVISSLYGETLPLVGTEAAAEGIPVITTRVGSTPEFADDPRFVVEPGSVDALAEALALYCSLTDAERSHLSSLARTRAEERYSPAVIAQKYHDLFASLVGGGRG
ncbi:MAG: glycosyltransferase [bacterium]|nr:glycosyltransferase [bacterium]